MAVQISGETRPAQLIDGWVLRRRINMSRRERILNNLKISSKRLKDALIELKAENIKSQFDYCTSPELSDIFDNIAATVKQIDKIIYQK